MKQLTPKIGFISYSNFIPPKGGGSVYAYYTTEGLRKLGHQIHVFDSIQHPLFVKYPRTTWGHLKMAFSIDAFAVNMEGDPDEDDFTLHPITKASMKPIMWHVQAPLEEQYAHPRVVDLAGLSWLIERRKRAAQYVSAASCVSPEMVEYAKNELGIVRAYCVPNGSDPILFSPDKRNGITYRAFRDKIKILWIGSPIYPWQGLPLIYKTARLLRKEKEFIFILIGEKKAFRIPILENMVIIDSIPHTDMPPHIASADICLCVYQPCNWSPFGFYFSPTKLFDYMACARPIVAANLGNIARIIEHGQNGILVEPGAEEIASAIRRLAQDKTLCYRVGSAAREDVVRFYNWERAAKQTAEILQKIT